VSPQDLALEQETDLAWVLSTPQGRRVIYRLAFDRELGMLLRTPRAADEQALALNVGRQDLARDILAIAERASQQLFEKMMSEAYDAARRVSHSLVPQDGDASSE
jgi:hypothetical protein